VVKGKIERGGKSHTEVSRQDLREGGVYDCQNGGVEGTMKKNLMTGRKIRWPL